MPAYCRSHCQRLNLLEFSLPGTPARSRAPSRPSSRPSSRPVSPSRRGLTRLGSETPSKGLSSDPLKAFPTQISQRIFRWLGITELATCARVSRKWNKSQTLNYSKSYLYDPANTHANGLRVKFGSSIIGRKTSTTIVSPLESGPGRNRSRSGWVVYL